MGPAVEPTVLDITALPTGFQVRLARPGEPFAGPTQRIWHLAVSGPVVRSLCRFVEQEVERDNAAEQPRDSFGPMCRALLDEILSDRVGHDSGELREALRTLDTPLLICTEGSAADAGVPWELLKFGAGEDDYLGLRCDVARRLKTRAVPVAVPRPDANFRALLIADPNAGEPGWELPDSAREVERLRDALTARRVDCSNTLVGADASLEKLFGRLVGQRWDIIHFAGHVVFDDVAREYGLRLHGGELLSAGTIRKHLRGTPMVFLNGCSSSSSEGAAVNRVGSIEGLTNAFLEAGAQLVVGSLFDTPDAGAREFAEKFYECVLDRHHVGEAMRLARRHVRGRPGCGAAWASFVLYGDPCLRIEVQADHLSTALLAAGLSRERFDTACLRTVERAFGYARGAGQVASAHLLAALIEGDDDGLRTTLHGMGVPAGVLSRTFRHVFRQHGREAPHQTAAELGNSVREVLRAAWALARAAHAEARIGERDVVEAFARHGGGSTGELLRRIGVDVAALAPSRAGSPVVAATPQSVGPLGRARCDAAAWQVLRDASSLGARSKPPLLGTWELLTALLHDPDGPAACALTRRGVDSQALLARLTGPAIAWPRPDEPASDAPCSPNAAQLLMRANQSALSRGERAVDVSDLLEAMLHGGGTAAMLLRDKVGLTLELVRTGLFDRSGHLIDERVDATVLHALGLALACAREKQRSTIGRTHLMRGMLAAGENHLNHLLAQVGCDAAVLADRLYVALPRGEEGRPVPDGLLARWMAPELIALLRDAELRSQSDGEPRLGDVALVRAMLADGCGSAGALLVEMGVSWMRLKELAELPPPRPALH